MSVNRESFTVDREIACLSVLAEDRLDAEEEIQ